MIILGVFNLVFGILAIHYYIKYELLKESIEQNYALNDNAVEESIAESNHEKREYETFTITSPDALEGESTVEYHQSSSPK